jgi:hypothetical protein
VNSFVDLILSSGRLGGVVGIIAGVACLAFSSGEGVGVGLLSVLVPGFGLLLVLLGGILLVHGNPEGGGFKAKDGVPPSDELLRSLGETQRPFFFCTRCRTIGAVGLCPKCKKGLDCVEIVDDEDLRLALIALT